MNEGKKNALEQAHSISRIESTIGDAGRVTGLARTMRLRAMALVAVSAGLYLHASASFGQDASMLDERVSQQNIATTICRPGYADTVSPPFDDMMELKDRMLAERGIDAGHGACRSCWADRRMRRTTSICCLGAGTRASVARRC